MKMIARMFCAAALVLGAVSLTGCGENAAPADAKSTTNDVKTAVKDTAKDAKAVAADAKAAVKDVKDAAKK